ATRVSADVEEARQMPGVTAVEVMSQPVTETQWAGAEIAAADAVTEEQATDAIRKIKVNYEVLPHLVKEDDLAKVGPRGKAAGEKLTGDADQGFKEADVVMEGQYGIPGLTHCCLQSHGHAIDARADSIKLWPSTLHV